MTRTSSSTVGIYLSRRRLSSIFELLGTKENNITYSIGWTLAHSPHLRRELLRSVVPDWDGDDETRITLQEPGEDHGFTDVEIIGGRIHAIVEAKRGWNLPDEGQLRRYLPRFAESAREIKVLVSMSEASSEYAIRRLPKTLEDVPVRHLSWKDVH